MTSRGIEVADLREAMLCQTLDLQAQMSFRCLTCSEHDDTALGLQCLLHVK